MKPVQQYIYVKPVLQTAVLVVTMFISLTSPYSPYRVNLYAVRNAARINSSIGYSYVYYSVTALVYIMAAVPNTVVIHIYIRVLVAIVYYSVLCFKGPA